ncbi:hypothetical protein BOX15_Mlig013757g3 [Macrostomum lignano]|uniref:Uncharacterized protein n=1 Tax=Macrostomum lignano TaxID=282301 RepID=A0A267G403_9PLAT|nr:hypothetical protein BOX15_Mlig013757g2 [Macrostomum lignano]PAA80778.1 hypothetical protein BOX15_Mlig013757g3 [Macrostomum lignano]
MSNDLSQHVAMLPADVGSIGISLRIMDSNGRLLVDLNQHLSLNQRSSTETVQLDVDCGETGSNNQIATTAYETDKFKSCRRSNSQRSQYRVRFDDSDSLAAPIATVSSASTMYIATPPSRELKTMKDNAASFSSSETSIDLIDRINGSLGRIASFARETRQQQQNSKQQQQQQKQQPKRPQYVSTQQQATSSDQFTSLSCCSAKDSNLSAPAVPICVKKTAWNAEELHYAIESDTVDDEDELLSKDTRQSAESRPATQATITFRGGFGDSNNFNVPTAANRPGSATTEAAGITGNSLANLLCKRYQRDIIIHTIRGVVDRLCRQQQTGRI